MTNGCVQNDKQVCKSHLSSVILSVSEGSRQHKTNVSAIGDSSLRSEWQMDAFRMTNGCVQNDKWMRSEWQTNLQAVGKPPLCKGRWLAKQDGGIVQILKSGTNNPSVTFGASFSLRLGHKTALALSTPFTTVLPLRYFTQGSLLVILHARRCIYRRARKRELYAGICLFYLCQTHRSRENSGNFVEKSEFFERRRRRLRRARKHEFMPKFAYFTN